MTRSSFRLARCRRQATFLISVALTGGACGGDGGAGPVAVSSFVASDAQCLASSPEPGTTGPSVHSRLASVLTAEGPTAGLGSDALVCLSKEGNRWRIGGLSAAGDQP